MERPSLVPFAARHRTPLTNEEAPGPLHRYDRKQQVWVCATSGEALVLLQMKRRISPVKASEFGETSITKTSEGHDQIEGRIDADSSAPAVDERRSTIRASQFGETTITESGEGTDQSEQSSSTW